MMYDIRIWEQISSTVEWKMRDFEQAVKTEITKDQSLRQFHGVYPVPWQLREVLKQRADSWIQRLYDLCCEVYSTSSRELSVEFDRAVWAYCLESFIMREVQTTADDYRASKLMELLLCAVGSTPEYRRSLKVDQKNYCVAVRNEMRETWYSKLHHIPSQIDEAVRALSQYNAIQARAARIAKGLPPEPPPTPPIASPASPTQILVSTASPDMPNLSDESNVAKSLNAQVQPSLSEPTMKPKNSAAQNWKSIEILFVSDHRVQIWVNGKSMETLNFTEFGFADGRTQNPNRAWEVLRALAEQSGIIRDGRTVGGKWSKIEKRIQEIRKVLREYFGLPGDPIPFVEGTGYQSLFKISCTRSFHS